MDNKKYIPVIGLEVHVELNTKSKMFCGCSADYFGAKPNTHVCPVCLGLPGSLPVSNKKAIKGCVMIGLALNCKIPLFSKFDRKNYFYPDLPKGYQISQYDKPFCVKGWIEINSSNVIVGIRRSLRLQNPSLGDSGQARMTKGKTIRIRRVHMEEDTAKLIHQFGTQNSKLKTQNYEGYSLIDFNRSGVPLVEIVSEPDFESATEVVEYLKKLQQIVRYLNVSNADMEKGEMRLEPNISLKPVILGIRRSLRLQNPSLGDSGQARMTKEGLPNYKVEVKNINSFRFVEKAINYEIERQRKILESGETPIQETRGWDEKKQITVTQRVKEEAMDYRYFPEPDIPPIHWSQSQILNLKSQIPELPDGKRLRFQKEYGLSEYDREILTREKSTVDYFEEAVRVNEKFKIKNEKCTDIKTIANWIINKRIDTNKIPPAQLIKNILKLTKTESIDTLELDKIIDKIILDNSKAIRDYKKGKTNAIMFLVGQAMRNMRKKVNVNSVRENLEKRINKL